MGLGLGLAIGSFALDAYGSWKEEKAADRAKKKRAKYFDNEISPLLNQQDTDVDFNAIRDVEMDSVIGGFQNQLRSINQNDDVMNSKSGFASNSFIDKETNFATGRANDSFKRNEFNVERTINDLQQQLENTISENKIRAKELEYSYKYG